MPNFLLQLAVVQRPPGPMAHPVRADRHPGARERAHVLLAQKAGLAEPPGDNEEGRPEAAPAQLVERVVEVRRVAVVEADPDPLLVPDDVEQRLELIQADPDVALTRIQSPWRLADAVKGDVTRRCGRCACALIVARAPVAVTGAWVCGYRRGRRWRFERGLGEANERAQRQLRGLTAVRRSIVGLDSQAGEMPRADGSEIGQTVGAREVLARVLSARECLLRGHLRASLPYRRDAGSSSRARGESASPLV